MQTVRISWRKSSNVKGGEIDGEAGIAESYSGMPGFDARQHLVKVVGNT